MADRMARDDARKSGGGRNPSASAPDGSSRMAYGGKTVYGATVGMLINAICVSPPSNDVSAGPAPL